MCRRSFLTYSAIVCCLLIVTASILVSISLSHASADDTEPLPLGTKIETILTDMAQPVAMAFDPGGRLFYTEKETGYVRLFANGALQPNPVITFTINSMVERGLLGIAIDPNFNVNHYIYVYYTADPDSVSQTLENRVVRFVENKGVGSNPTIIFSSPQGAKQHVGGNIHFGPDGKLYVSIGDSGNWANSQDVTTRPGKIHRINPDGTIPSDNPKFGQNALPTLYAIGLRNSFDFAFDSVVRGRIFATENGPSCDDEMNRIEAGFNYGWRPDYPCDDNNPDPKFNSIPPMWHTGQADCCPSPTGITVYAGTQITQWRNHLFMASFNDGALRHFYLNGTRTEVTASKVVQGITANTDLETGPDGAFWYIEGGGYAPGTLKRIVSTGSSTPVTPLASPPGIPSVTPPVTIPGSGSRTFPQTGKAVTGIFLDYWNKHGGLPQQGYPISGLVREVSDQNGTPYAMQYFERAVFEYHPENTGTPYEVLLSQLGTFQYRKKYPAGAPGQQPNNSPGSILFPQTGRRVGGTFLSYWQKNGGLPQQGYPISDEFMEKSDLDGKTYRVQYFERAVLEYHLENRPPYDVLLSQLGTYRWQEKYGKP